MYLFYISCLKFFITSFRVQIIVNSQCFRFCWCCYAFDSHAQTNRQTITHLLNASGAYLSKQRRHKNSVINKCLDPIEIMLLCMWGQVYNVDNDVADGDCVVDRSVNAAVTWLGQNLRLDRTVRLHRRFRRDPPRFLSHHQTGHNWWDTLCVCVCVCVSASYHCLLYSAVACVGLDPLLNLLIIS